MDDCILHGLGCQGDSRAQQQAAQYFEQLKQSESGWQLCMNALITHSYNGNDPVRFFCFQVIEDFLKNRYKNATAVEQNSVRTFLMSWIQNIVGSKEQTFILNKVAQLFVLTCLSDYPERWPLFFDDLLESLKLNSMSPATDQAVDMYLRILIALHTDVVDRDILHTDQELQRNTIIKDSMRTQCILKLVNSWGHILVTYETSSPSIVCMCLQVVGAYISWIDIGLIANDRFVSVLLRFMTQPLIRETACDCIYEIISKGMDPMAKIKLIESFATILDTSGLLTVNEDDDGDYLAKLANLITGMGQQLIQCWNKFIKSKDTNGANLAFEALQPKLPIMLKLLCNDDDDVSSTVVPFAHDYLSFLKQIVPLDNKQKTVIKEMLCIIVQKMKFDDTYSFENEGEEEAMFQEYRKELKVIINNLGALDSDMLINVINEVVNQTLPRWQVAEYQEVEVAITLLYQLGELVPMSGHNPNVAKDGHLSTLHDMIKLLLTSGVSCHQHPAVQLQFFETIVRYEKFFATYTQFIPDVLTAFLDERGLWSLSAHVRSRTSYLFSRFVKSINKSHLQGFLEIILDRIQGLLILNTPADNGLKVLHLSAEDQQFMFETASILIVQSQFSPEKKQELLQRLLVPLLSKFDQVLDCLLVETDANRQMELALCLNQAMAFASRTSKGFSGQQTVQLNGCTQVYVDSVHVFLRVINVPFHRPVLHQGLRQFLHRMVVCLDTNILQFVPIAIESLLKFADAKQLYDFIPFINQLVQKFKKGIVPYLQQVFMPVVSIIFQALTMCVDERDQVAQMERKMLQRGYFTFISTLVNNNVSEVLSNQSRENLEQVLLTIIHGAVDIPDPVGQKTCFSVLKKLVELWGDKNCLVGFDDFMYKQIVSACFVAPSNPTFDLTDAQTILVLNEAAGCLKAIWEKRGDEFLLYLQSEYLLTLEISMPVIEDFCQNLKSNGPKVFQGFYKAFFIQARHHSS